MTKEIITLLRLFAKHRNTWLAILAGLVFSVFAFDSIGFEFTSSDMKFQFEATKSP